MEDLEDGDDIEREFPKEELLEVYKRLENGDETALEPWNLYFEKLAGYSAGKCAKNANGRWHENLYNERYHDAWRVAADIGREVLKGKTKIEGEPENYVWAAIRYRMIACDKDDRGDGSTKSKSGWQGKKWNFTEVEIPVVTPSMSEILEEIFVCCKDDFERKVVTLFIENGNDPKTVAELLGVAIEKVQQCRGRIAERRAERLRDQDEPSRALEEQAKKLKGTRKPRHQPPNQPPKQSKVWPADKPKGSKVATTQAK